MGKKEDFNKGVESGLKVATAVIEKEVEAMDYLKNKISSMGSKQDKMNEAVNMLLEDTNEQSIERIFNITKSFSLDDLEDHEKKILLSILATLSVAGVNESQREYSNNLRHFINCPGYEMDCNYDFSKISNIESVKSVKIIAKAVRIFLFLKELNMDAVYMHDDDLFSFFEIRTSALDEIDASIELIAFIFGAEGLVEYYGVKSDDENNTVEEPQDIAYLNIEQKEKLDISFDCAQIYFKDCYIFDSNKQYIESSSYIIYNDGDKIYRLHKSTCEKAEILNDIDNPGDFIKKGKITTYYDMSYYVIDNDLYYLDLDSLKSGKILHIEEKLDKEGNKYDVSNLVCYKSKKMIYKNGSKYILDMQDEKSVKSISFWGESNKYFLKDDYLYYVDSDPDLDDLDKRRYAIYKYGILSGQVTVVSQFFGIHKEDDSLKALYEIESEGIYGKYYYCVFGYQGIDSMERQGFDCFFVNIENDMSKASSFYIWNSRVYQIEQYADSIVYVNADKDYSLISHNFINDKKKVIIKKYGNSDKASFSQKMFLGKSAFQNPEKYMRLGRWLWIKKSGTMNYEIVSL